MYNSTGQTNILFLKSYFQNITSMQQAGSAKIWKENTDFSLLLKTKKIVHILIHFQYSTSQHSSVWPKLFGGAYVFIDSIHEITYYLITMDLPFKPI